MAMKHFSQNLPEYYLIAAVLLAGYTPPFTFNWPMLLFAALVGAQIIVQNRLTGLLMAIAFVVGSLFFGMAWISELSEFDKPGEEGTQLLVVGGLLFTLNLALSLAMLLKYLRYSKVAASGVELR